MRHLWLLIFQQLLLITCLSAQSSTVEKKNVLFIIVDDLNADMSTYDHPLVKTPNLDGLAKRGVKFNKAYCQFPLCNPSRASMLNGLRPDTTQVFGNNTYFRNILPTAITMPMFFKNNGYITGRFGKGFHGVKSKNKEIKTIEDEPAWDQIVYPPKTHIYVKEKLTDYTPGRDIAATLNFLAADEIEDKDMLPDMELANETVKALEKVKDKPFFFLLGFHRPHSPYIAPEKYFDMYNLKDIKLPDEPEDDLNDVPPVALWTNPPYWNVNDPAKRKEVIRAYYACVSYMDDQMGKVLNALDRLDLTKNTVIVFVSDHGYNLSEHKQWMKQSLFEKCARVPMVIALPNAKVKGKVSEGIVEMVDLYKTVADACGLKAPAYIDGKSLMPLLNNPNAAWNYPAYTQVARKGLMGRSIRNQRYRYTEWGNKGAELYDYTKDPKESNNLVKYPAYATVIAEMKQLLDKKIKNPTDVQE